MPENKTPFLSIVVLCFKVEKYLPQCLESLRRQTFKDFEVIMVDDGSPDNCGIICDTYAAMDPRFKVIHQENKGIIRARKAALALACGEFCGSVDGDDWASLDMYEKMVNAQKKYNVDFVQCEELLHFANQATRLDNQRPTGLYLGDDYRSIIKKLNTKGYNFIEVSLCRSILRTEKLREIMYKLDDSCGLCEDAVCMYVYAAYANGMYNIGEDLYHYRRREDSCTTDINARDEEKLYRLYSEAELLLRDKSLGEPLLKELASYFIGHIFITLSKKCTNMKGEERKKYIQDATSDGRFQHLWSKFKPEEYALFFEDSVIQFIESKELKIRKKADKKLVLFE